MPNKVVKIKDFRASSTDLFFFDNNVWMFLFCPLANYERRKQEHYSDLLQTLISRNIHIYTNSLILSEFSNRYLRLDYNIVRNEKESAGKYNDFKKDYIGSERYKSTAKEVLINMNKILSICQKSSDEFTSIDINGVLGLSQTLGFNDSYYCYLAQKKNWIIVTDDSDIVKKLNVDKNLKILTA